MKRIPRSKSALVAAVGVALVSVLAGCASTTSDSSGVSGSSSDSSTSSTKSASGSTSAQSTSDDSASYKDGTYSVDESYTSPGGQEEVAVSVTVKSDLITAVTVKTIKAEGQGGQYQARFESAISGTVVGKSLSSLSVSRVAGSSLTSEAFDSALDAIRTEAAA